MFKVHFRIDAVLAVTLCLCISYTALGDSEHEASADTENSEETTQVAKQRIVESRPPVGTLGTLLQKMQPSMTADSFSKLVEKTSELNDAQKSALKSSFRTVADKTERPSEEFQRVMGSAIAELYRGDQVPEAAKAAAAEGQAGAPAQAGQPGQGAEGQSGEKKIPEEVKALQEQIKQLQAERGSQFDRLRDSLRNRANEEAKNRGEGQGQGGGGQGGGQGGQGQAGGQGGNEGGGSGGNDSRALKALASAFKGNDNKKNNNNNNNNNGNNNNNAAKSSESQDRERQAARERESARSRSASSEDTPAASSDDKKKKKEKDKALEDAKNLANQVPQETKPEVLSANKNYGPKSSLNAIPQSAGFGGFGGGGFGGGFGGIDGFGNAGGGAVGGAGAFGGAKVNGGGVGAGGGGGDLGSMRFDSDFAGPMGGKLGSTGQIYADGGSGSGGGSGADGDAAAGFEAELAGNALAANQNRYYSNASQVEFPSEKVPFKGNILDRYFGKTVREGCSEDALNQVAMCRHPRAKGFISTRLSSS